MRIASVIVIFTLLFAISTVYAENQTNSSDPCANVVCNTLPPIVCNGSSLTTYSMPGTCSNGVCSYPSSTTTCQYGCEQGACVIQNACTGVVCNSPPPSYCEGSNVRSYSTQGVCAAGQCTYTLSTGVGSCQYGCTNGQCNAAPVTNQSSVTVSVTHMPTNPTPDAVATILATSSATGTIYVYVDGALVKTCTASTSCTHVIEHPTAGTHNYYATFTDSTGTQRTTQSYSFTVAGAYANNCADTDGGQNYNTRGTVTYNLNYAASSQYTLADSCSGSTLNEYYCTPEGLAQTAYYTCPSGCLEGACKTTTSECISGQTRTETCSNGQTYVREKCVEGSWAYTDASQCPTTRLYRYAKWSCYGDSAPTVQGGETTCKDTATWKSYAEETCRSRGGVNSFVVDGECSQGSTPTVCPAGCRCEKDSTGVMRTYCDQQQLCNYNNVCERGEDGCKDCVTGRECPIERKCSDGSVVACHGTATTCSCQQCPIPANDLPYGCTQEKDDGGFIRVVCDNYRTSCPAIDRVAKTKCTENGGTPVIKRGYNDCEYFYCDFGERSASIFSGVQCQTPEEMSHVLDKCEELGLRSAVTFENGCKIGRCLEHKTECPATGETDKREMEQKCSSEGRKLVYGYNDNGCQELRCEAANYCENDLPREAYDKCANDGGQLLVKRDGEGCVAFSECIRRGDTRKTYVDKITKVPDSSDLLSMAFKLEDLKLQLDGLSKKSRDIADYYKTTASTDEERFRRVSNMFSAAAGRVDEIKIKIRERLNNLNTDDMTEIKRDIRYIKDVIIKDILYVMLSTGDDIEKIKSDEKKDCGYDMDCFNDALRICQPVTFIPDEENNIRVELRGLEDNKCVLYASAGPLDMNCKLEKYSLGVSDPATDVLPYCTGSLVAIVKTQMSSVPRNSADTVPGAGYSGGGDFAGGFGEGEPIPPYNSSCAGCLNNGICDAGECSYCSDCNPYNSYIGNGTNGTNPYDTI